jgi:hypothetical protein
MHGSLRRQRACGRQWACLRPGPDPLLPSTSSSARGLMGGLMGDVLLLGRSGPDAGVRPPGRRRPDSGIRRLSLQVQWLMTTGRLSRVMIRVGSVEIAPLLMTETRRPSVRTADWLRRTGPRAGCRQLAGVRQPRCRCSAAEVSHRDGGWPGVAGVPQACSGQAVRRRPCYTSP